jgi:hypothetical protein
MSFSLDGVAQGLRHGSSDRNCKKSTLQHPLCGFHFAKRMLQQISETPRKRCDQQCGGWKIQTVDQYPKTADKRRFSTIQGIDAFLPKSSPIWMSEQDVSIASQIYGILQALFAPAPLPQTFVRHCHGNQMVLFH